MAGQNQGGGQGPWGGGQGPWGGGQGPWGGGSTPSDIEELLRRGQDRIKRMLPGGGGWFAALVGLAVILVFWLGSGLYRVQPGEVALQLLFGKYHSTTAPGLNFWLPTPFGEVIKVNVERTNTVNVGFRVSNNRTSDVPLESLMITSDQNIIDIDFVVQWRIKAPEKFIFNMRDPISTVKIAAESAMREVIGQTPLEAALTTRREQVQEISKTVLQKLLDDYGIGVSIAEIQLQNVDPPTEVIDAFQDVQRAKQDQERFINEATAYKNDIIPRARGDAQRAIQEASAYRERVIKEAQGEAKRFLSVYETYVSNKEVTIRRLFLERMQDVLRKSDKVIIDSGSGSGVVPYLPLPELKKRQETNQ